MVTKVMDGYQGDGIATKLLNGYQVLATKSVLL